MSAILEQLGLDHTFFYQLAVFAALFLLLKQVYFKPFMRLLDARHKKTVEDRESAEKLIQQAQGRLEEYQRRLAEERLIARRDYEDVVNQAKKEEAALLAHAREEAKKVTQQAASDAEAQHEKLRKQLELEVETFARSLSERLLSRKV